ncbi:MAG: TatD family hydrolase [Verrucomicrobiota bacterium]
MDPLYDTHAHLDFPDFNEDREQVIQRARAAGITKIITVGTDLTSSRQALALAEQHEGIHAVVGWHPSHVTEAPADIRPALRELARHPKTAALGETGLDYHRLPSAKSGGSAADDAAYKSRQAELFRQHLEVAAETGLNCVIHQRDALEDTLAVFQPFANRVRGVFHCFVNDTATMRRILDLNSLVSFTGVATFKNAQEVRDTLAATPLGSFMLETDCPYLAPVPYRGKRCEPAYVRDLSKVVLQVKGCTESELSAATCATAEKFFRGL